MKTITKEMRDRAAQIQKIIEELWPTVSGNKDALVFPVYEDYEARAIDVRIIWRNREKNTLRGITYYVDRDAHVSRWTSSWGAVISHGETDPTPEAISEDLRWLLGEDGKQVKREDV